MRLRARGWRKRAGLRPPVYPYSMSAKTDGDVCKMQYFSGGRRWAAGVVKCRRKMCEVSELTTKCTSGALGSDYLLRQ